MTDKWFVRGVDQTLVKRLTDMAKERGIKVGRLVSEALRQYLDDDSRPAADGAERLAELERRLARLEARLGASFASAAPPEPRGRPSGAPSGRRGGKRNPLPEATRKAIFEMVDGGMSHGDAARQIGISRATVSKLMTKRQREAQARGHA